MTPKTTLMKKAKGKSMDTKVNLQLDLEQSSLLRGRDRIEADMMKDLERGTLGTSSSRLLKEATVGVTAAIRELQVKTQAEFETQWAGRGGRTEPSKLVVLALDAEVLAFLVIRSVLTTVNRESSVQAVCTRMVQAIEDTLWLTEVKDLEKTAARERGYTPRNRIPKMMAELRKYSPRTIKRWQKRLEDLPTTEWSKVSRVHLGGELLGAAEPHLKAICTITEQQSLKDLRYVRVKGTFIESLSQDAARSAYLHPFYLPMITPPRPWDNHGKTLQGGYMSLRAAGLKTFVVTEEGEGHTQVYDIGPEHLEAMNVLQSVPWTVNNFVLEHASRAFQSDVGPLPYEPPVPLPDRVEAELWETMTDDERRNHQTQRGLAYTHNHRQEAAKLAHMRALNVAEEFADYEHIYFPHAMDYRGRFYPIPQDLHPQGPDMVKGMLKLGESKPLGERGLVWLECHTANTYGLDKEDRLTQQMWTTANWDRIMLVGQDPWLDLEFWQGADEPWQFLAAAHEMYLAHSSDDPASYESNLLVSVDGSCNGIQHLSAMGLDPVGATAVNLKGGTRQDIYQIVADKVNASLTQDSVWYGKVSRKTVKRAVMTTPYGVTPSGIAEQLRGDGFTRGMDDQNAASHELRDRIVAALDGTIVKGVEVMKWFKECATLLTKDGTGVTWETPTGTVVRQFYMQLPTTRVRTPFGDVAVLKEVGTEPKLKATKQKNSVSPNIIHSFDAAHLAKVVVATVKQGVVVGAVHDSYGTHACDVDALLETTKAEFISIYSHNWFERLRASLIFHSKRPTLPEPPARGDLDIEEVRKSDYFFA